MKKLTVALALGLASSSVLALGLGQIKVTSGLNEPLRAEIPVLSSDASELRGLKVELASAEDFERIGLSLAQLDVPLQFAVVKRHGSTVIAITTKAAVSEPALDFLVEVNWPKGKLLREYTILLDPPNMAPLVATTPVQAAAPAATVTTQAAKPAPQPTPPTVASPPSPSQSTTTAAAPAKPAQVSHTPVATAAVNGAITVNKGDTLWQIAQNTHDAAGIGINEMMLALQRTNPHAFYKNNINALKSGAVLRMPDHAQLTKLRPGAAHAAVREQNQRWASIQAQAPVMVSNTGGAAESAADHAGQTNRERLQLVPPTHGSDAADSRPGVAGGTGNTRVTALKAQLANAKTALTSAQQQSSDLQGRVTDLEGINNKNTHLISLKNTEIAELQRKLADAQKAAAAAAVAAPLVAEVPAAATPSVSEAVAAATVAEPAAAASVREDIFNTNAPAATASSAAALAATTPASAATTAMASASSAAMSMTPATASTAMAAEAATTSAETAPVTQSEAQQAAASNATEAQPWYMQNWLKWLIGLVILALIALGLMKSRGKKVAAPILATTDAADVAADSEEDEEYALINEIEQRPDDLASHMELASLYYAQRDQDKFEATAEAMHAHVTDPQCDEWQQVRAMGEELCPDAPLFASLHSDGDAVTAAPLAAAAPADHDDLDRHAGAEHATKSGDGYSFDFDLTPTSSAQAAGDHVATTIDSDGHEPDVHALSETDAEDDLGFGIASAGDVDVDTPDAHEFDEETAHGSFSSDPVDTKLDLARAYQDMGDAEGARAMLDEVLAEGSDAQKDVARKLLEELS